MRVVQLQRDAAATETGQQPSGAVKCSAPSGGSEQSANKQQRIGGPDDDDGEIVCLS
jgi:hypothetical protein